MPYPYSVRGLVQPQMSTMGDQKTKDPRVDAVKRRMKMNKVRKV